MAGTQSKKGYLRGVRGIRLIKLLETGEKPAEPEIHWIDTAQEVGVEAEVVAGESADLRGGDRLLLRVEEDDSIVGVNLEIRDAKFDAKATELIAGGTLITDPASPIGSHDIVGWEAPTIAEQADRIPFEAEVYIQAFDDQGGREAYLKYTFVFCKGNAAEITHTDRMWGTPEFEIKARENPHTNKSTYRKEFIDLTEDDDDILAPELQLPTEE